MTSVSTPTTAQSNSQPTSLEIGRRAHLRSIADLAGEMGIPQEYVEPYGRDVAKIDLRAADALAEAPRAKYIVVSAITPTPLGEGKTTTTIGLGDGLRRIGKRATIAIREASMGPTFGIKGGGAGGGYSQVVPMERLNLHLTGDIHAVTAAHNQLAAMLDAHLMHGNALGVDPESITWRRVIDVNDRALRDIVTGLGPRTNGLVRQTGFDITAASEVMTILSLASGVKDLRERLGRIVVGFTYDGEPVTAEDLQAAGAMAVILREAIKPNLLQTLEGTPALVHAGPFGNIATGNSSVVADLVGSRTGEFLITEAGFGADMGAERFFNIKCRVSGLTPDAAIVVATVRALKAHSGNYTIVAGRPLPPEILEPNPDDVRAGAVNLRKQIQNIKAHGVTPVVAINAFAEDHDEDQQVIFEIAQEEGVRCALTSHFADGGEGALDLARMVVEAVEEPVDFEFLYPEEAPLKEKIETIARVIYGADGVDYSPAAERDLARYEANGWAHLPVCLAKTHLSLSSDPTLKGAPTGWRLPVREVRASVGAGFIYPIAGAMQTMPGLGSAPAAISIDIDDEGNIVGLF